MRTRARSLGEDAEPKSGLQLTIALAIVIAVLGGATALMDDGTDVAKGKAAVERSKAAQTR